MFDVKHYIRKTCKQFANKSSTQNQTTTSMSKQPAAKRAKVSKTSFRLVYQPVDADEESNSNERDVDQEIIFEINTFYQMKYPVDEDTCPLVFFKEKGSSFPHLTRLAKMIFSIPASAVASESLFSEADEIATDRRNRLNPQLLEELLFLKKNKNFSI